MELQIIPRYVDTIVINNSNENNVKLITAAGYKFDDDECELTMEFYDGVAYDVTGTGLMLRYPTMKEVEHSQRTQTIICDYVGVFDGTINQHDVALTYGVLELSDKEEDKVIHTTKQQQSLRDETLILLSDDIYQKVYNMSDDNMDYNRAARIVRELADQFEQELDWRGCEDEDRDYILELEAFEEKALKQLEREVDIKSKWD